MNETERAEYMSIIAAFVSSESTWPCTNDEVPEYMAARSMAIWKAADLEAKAKK